jgi:hypothetical protein
MQQAESAHLSRYNGAATVLYEFVHCSSIVESKISFHSSSSSTSALALNLHKVDVRVALKLRSVEPEAAPCGYPSLVAAI